jgi:ribosomal protein L37AE/L43A
MFQRLTTVANGLFENTAEVFKYELSSVPSSMFDCNGLPREASKSNLANAIWACGSDCTHEIDGEGFQYVLDGGSLLQRNVDIRLCYNACFNITVLTESLLVGFYL